jgi:hypothetical protein
MKRYPLFSTTWIAASCVMMIMTFTLSLAAADAPSSNAPSQSTETPRDSESVLKGKIRALLQKELNGIVYPPFNSPANPYLHPRKEPTAGKRFIKQTWTSIDGKKYRALKTGTQRYLFTKSPAPSK